MTADFQHTAEYEEIRRGITMSDTHQLVNGLENGEYNAIVQVSHNDIIAFQ